MRLFILFSLLIVFSMPVHAKSVADFCENIENTADLVECLNKYNEKVKGELSVAFEKTFKSLAADNAALLKGAQQSWIDYRNKECQWEVKNEETESLKRVRELHCLIRMTNNRKATIDNYNKDLQQYNKSHGVSARWKNVLFASYPDIFWQTGKRYQTDINCDGQKENTLLGINIDSDGQREYTVAFVEMRKTGKPLPIVLDLPIEDEGTLCGRDIVIMAPEIKINEQCEPVPLHVKNGDCAIYEVLFDNGNFSFQKKGLSSHKEEGGH